MKIRTVKFCNIILRFNLAKKKFGLEKSRKIKNVPSTTWFTINLIPFVLLQLENRNLLST